MPTLHATINALASEFAHDLLRALRDAPLKDIVAETSSGHVQRRAARRVSDGTKSIAGHKRVRRSPETLKKLADQIVALVAKHPKGIRAEELKAAMGVKPGNVGAKVFTKPLSVALASKKIRKRGHRRATTYFSA